MDRFDVALSGTVQKGVQEEHKPVRRCAQVQKKPQPEPEPGRVAVLLPPRNSTPPCPLPRGLTGPQVTQQGCQWDRRIPGSPIPGGEVAGEWIPRRRMAREDPGRRVPGPPLAATRRRSPTLFPDTGSSRSPVLVLVMRGQMSGQSRAVRTPQTKRRNTAWKREKEGGRKSGIGR